MFHNVFDRRKFVSLFLVITIVLRLSNTPLIFAAEDGSTSKDSQLETVFISEFMPAPSVGDEWVEVCNVSKDEVTLNNWQVDDIEGGSAPVTILEDIVLLQEECHVVSFASKLNNSGDTVRLLDDNSDVVDSFVYEKTNQDESFLRVNHEEWMVTNDPNPGELVWGKLEAAISTDKKGNADKEDEPITIDIETSHKIVEGEPFTVNGMVKNAKVSAKYVFKLLGGVKEEKLYDVDTKNNNDWYAWNTSWSNLPTFNSDKNGDVSFKLSGLAETDIQGSTLSLGIRMREVGTTKNIDSELIAVSFQQAKDTSNDNKVLSEHESKIDEKIEILLIDDIKNLSEEVVVRVEGVVTSGFNELGSKTFYIQDSSGGIKIVSRDGNLKGIVRGKKVTIIGEVAETFNEKYIKIVSAEDVQVNGDGDLPDPLSVPTGNVGEENEGKLVNINGQVAATSGNTFYIDDGTGPVKVYIKDSTAIDKPYMRTGYYSAITGIVSQYNDDHRILPRKQDDVIVSKTPIPSILGSVTQLPQTAVGFGQQWVIGGMLVMVGILLRLTIVFIMRGGRSRWMK